MPIVNRVYTKVSSSQLLSWIPYIVAIGVLLYLGWAVSVSISYPYDGLGMISPTGTIYEIIDPTVPGVSEFKEGDKIIKVGGVYWGDALPLYGEYSWGETVDFNVLQDGKLINVEIALEKPPTQEILIRLLPLFVALVFWGVGFSVLVRKPLDVAANIFFVWCLVSTVTLISGAISYMTSPVISSVFNILLWFIGPLSVNLHMVFPQSINEKFRKLTLGILYVVAMVGSFPYLATNPFYIRSASWYPDYLTATRLFLIFNLLFAAALLFFNYRHTKSPGARGKIRILALGGIIIAMLLVILTFIPDALFHQPIIPFSYSVVLLIFLPLTYGYSIFRFHLIEIERYVNRTAIIILVYGILSGIYFFLYWLFQQQTWIPQKSVSFITTLFVLFLASIYSPLYKQVRKFVDTIFYGGWYDYRSGITKMTQGLNQITDLRILAKVISERLINTLRLEDACVFLKDEKGDFSVIEVSSSSNSESMKRPEPKSIPKKSLTYLLKVGVIERKSLKEELKDVELTPEELQLLNSEQIHLWVPVVVHGEIQGLMALGQKIGGDVYSGEDMDILRIVAMQIGPVIENIHLLSQLKQYAADLEKRVAERTLELYTSKERVATILASVGDGVVVTDLNGTIVMVNKVFEKQTGFSEEELIGDNYFMMLQKENDREILNDMQKTLLSGSVWTGELVSRRKDNTMNDIQLTIAPVRDQIGKMISFVGSQRDITRQKELDRLKDMFVADVSHELRTPTTNINLYLELLESAPIEKRKHYIDVIKEQGKLLSRLVEDILDLSTLTMSRAKKVEFSPVNLNLLTEQVVTAHQPVADAAGIRLTFVPDPFLPSIMGEQNQIARLINNLVSNAVRYTKEGEVTLTTYQGKNNVVIKIEDTGIGIDIEDIPHIFERFYRGKFVRQTNIHGTGLGLAIVKEIMDLHEGKIRVDSIFGKGSTFYAIFPLKARKAQEEAVVDNKSVN